MFENFLKTSLYPVVWSIIAHTGLHSTAVALLGILLVADFLTAVFREWVIDPQRLKSRIAIIGMLSKTLVFLIPLLVGAVATEIDTGFDLKGFSGIVLSVLIVAELYSVIGNIVQIREKDTTVSEYDAVTVFVRFVQNTIKTVLEKMFPNNN